MHRVQKTSIYTIRPSHFLDGELRGRYLSVEGRRASAECPWSATEYLEGHLWAVERSQHTGCQGIWGLSLHLRTVATAIEVARGRGCRAACPGGITNWGTVAIGFLCLICLALRAAPATAWRSRSAARLRDAGWRGATSRSLPQTCQAADIEAFHKGLSLRGI